MCGLQSIHECAVIINSSKQQCQLLLALGRYPPWTEKVALYSQVSFTDRNMPISLYHSWSVTTKPHRNLQNK